MKMSWRALLCATALLLAPHLSAAETTPNASEPIRVGSILILSGEGAATGTASRNGIMMAVDDLNTKGGVLGRPIQVDYQDDQGDPKKTISAFRELSGQGVQFVIGPTWSNQGLVLIDIAERAKVLTISPSLGMAKFNESSPYLFNTWPHDYILSQELAAYVYGKGHRKVALVGAEHVWVKEQTLAFTSRFKELGGAVVYTTEPLPGTTDLRSEALKIKGLSEVDAVVSTTDGIAVGSLVAKALRDFQVKLPWYSITLDQSAIDAAQGGFEGLEFLTFLTPSKEFKERYEARFQLPIDIGGDSAYDAVMMLAQAIEDTGSTDATIVSAELAKIKTYAGASGALTSDGKRGFVRAYAKKKVVSGKASDL